MASPASSLPWVDPWRERPLVVSPKEPFRRRFWRLMTQFLWDYNRY